MESSAAIILKLNEIKRKIETMQARIDNFEVRSDSDDTEHLIAEEVHWIIKVLRILFCFVSYNNVTIQIHNREYGMRFRYR